MNKKDRLAGTQKISTAQSFISRYAYSREDFIKHTVYANMRRVIWLLSTAPFI